MDIMSENSMLIYAISTMKTVVNALIIIPSGGERKARIKKELKLT